MSKKLACFLIVLAAACGKAGVPHPPVPEIPAATTDLVVSQRAGKVILRWSYPSLSTAGKTLMDLRKIVVYRYVDALPESLASKLSGDGAKPASELFDQVALPLPPQYVRAAEPVAEVTKDELPAFAAGAKIEFEDAPPIMGEAGVPLRYVYAVVTEGLEKPSGFSNLAPIVLYDVPEAPPALTAQLTPEAVVLSWEKPMKSTAGAETPQIQGYAVYRTATGEIAGDAVAKVNASATRYEDRPPYGRYSYRVTAVAANEPALSESAPSTSAEVDFRDLLPPGAPKNVAALTEEKLVRLIWDPVTAPDLAGYVVYRESGGTKTRLTASLLTDAIFRDEAPPTGVGIVYSVTSVDQSGNESAPARAAEVTIAR
ncbi:MAG: fibronectin type III domain-containing protein [Acidobacteria bacterium]|nr:fibronectin type III domain-containing protein [Acidobacteriota bacterium]